jgi:hypothetical protein
VVVLTYLSTNTGEVPWANGPPQKNRGLPATASQGMRKGGWEGMGI